MSTPVVITNRSRKNLLKVEVQKRVGGQYTADAEHVLHPGDSVEVRITSKRTFQVLEIKD